MKKVTWSAGHDLNTSGKRTPDGEREWTFNNKVVLAAMDKLNEYQGVTQLRLDDPTGAKDIPLIDRSNKANAWGTDLHVDVHHNALNDVWINGGIGIETFAMQGTKHYAESLKLAKLVHPKYVQAMGLKDRGIKSQNLHMLRLLQAPAILTEGGFMDSKVDIVAMRNDARLKAQGEAIALGVVAYLGLKKKEAAKVAEKPKADYIGTSQETSIQKAIDAGVMKGYDSLRFGQNDPLTRGQFATILDRMGWLDKK